MPVSRVPHPRFMLSILALSIVALVLGFAPIASVAMAQTDALMQATPMVDPGEPLPDTEEEQSEDVVGTQLTPTPLSTAIPTSVPPTPTPTPTGDVSAQRIVNGSGCTQISPTDTVPVGTAVEFRCIESDGPGNSTVSRTFTGLTVGWEYQVNDGPWQSTVGPTFSQPDRIPAFILRLRPTNMVAPGSQGSLTVQLSTSNGDGAYTATVGASRQPAVAPTAADLQLTCDPVSVLTDVNTARIVTCTYSGRASLNTRQVVLTRVTVPVPAGWSVTSPAGTATATTLTITPNAIISYSASSPQSYTFSYTLTPGCTASTTARPINLTSAFSFSTTTGIAGATFSQTAARSNANSLAVSVVSNSLIWNETYSLQDSSVQGNLTYQVVASGCSGWNIQVSTSPYVYTGPNSGEPIPASNLTLTTTGSPFVISGDNTGVSRQPVSGQITTPTRVMNATAGSGNGTYHQQLEFNLTIPGRSLTGSYQSTITVTSAAAP